MIKMKNNVRKYRVFYGLTQKELAKKVGCSVVTIQRIERIGFISRYPIRMMICRVFNVNHNQVWEVDDEQLFGISDK